MRNKESEKIFLKIYDESFDSIFRYIKSKISNYEDAEDLAQDVFLVLFENIRDGTDVHSPMGFLKTISYRKVVDYWRKKYKMPEVSIEKILGSNFEKEREIDKNKKLEKMSEWLKKTWKNWESKMRKLCGFDT